jgi:DNA-binding response OmpR family regulator
VRWSLRERFLQHGYSVLESGTGAAAIAEFSRSAVDVVLLDSRLPDSDGIAVLRRMMTLEPHAVVILMNASPTLEHISEAAEYGARGYVIKPFDLDEVVACVDRWRIGERP